MKKIINFVRDLLEDFSNVVFSGMYIFGIIILSASILFLLCVIVTLLIMIFKQLIFPALFLILLIVIFFIFGGIGRAFSLLYENFQNKDTKGENDEEIME